MANPEWDSPVTDYHTAKEMYHCKSEDLGIKLQLKSFSLISYF